MYVLHVFRVRLHPVCMVKLCANLVRFLSGSYLSPFSPYLQAKEAFKKGEYDQVIPLCSEETNLSNSSFLAEALLLRATFYLLRGEGNKAIEDFDRLLLLENTDKKVRNLSVI